MDQGQHERPPIKLRNLGHCGRLLRSIHIMPSNASDFEEVDLAWHRTAIGNLSISRVPIPCIHSVGGGLQSHSCVNPKLKVKGAISR